MMARAFMSMSAANRFLAAIVGGYVFVYGFVAASTLLGFHAGLPFHESQTLAWMLGLVCYLCVMLWAFTPRRSITVWLVLGGGGVLMGVAAWYLSRMGLG